MSPVFLWSDAMAGAIACIVVAVYFRRCVSCFMEHRWNWLNETLFETYRHPIRHQTSFSQVRSQVLSKAICFADGRHAGTWSAHGHTRSFVENTTLHNKSTSNNTSLMPREIPNILGTCCYWTWKKSALGSKGVCRSTFDDDWLKY